MSTSVVAYSHSFQNYITKIYQGQENRNWASYLGLRAAAEIGLVLNVPLSAGEALIRISCYVPSHLIGSCVQKCLSYRNESQARDFKDRMYSVLDFLRHGETDAMNTFRDSFCLAIDNLYAQDPFTQGRVYACVHPTSASYAPLAVTDGTAPVDEESAQPALRPYRRYFNNIERSLFGFGLRAGI